MLSVKVDYFVQMTTFLTNKRVTIHIIYFVRTIFVFIMATNSRYNDVDSITCWTLNVLFYSLYKEKQGHKRNQVQSAPRWILLRTFVTKEFNFKNVL